MTCVGIGDRRRATRMKLRWLRSVARDVLWKARRCAAELESDAEKVSIDGTPEPRNSRKGKEKASLNEARPLSRNISIAHRGFPTTLSSLSVSSKRSYVLAAASTHRCQFSYQTLNRPARSGRRCVKTRRRAYQIASAIRNWVCQADSGGARLL